MSSRIVSPAEMFATDVTLMFVAPAGASAPRNACVPGLPTALTVATSYDSIVFATAGYAAPYPSAIFSPTTKPVAFVTGTLVDPAGIVITGPSGSGCQIVVALPAGVPTLTILRVSAPEPLSMLIESPTFRPAVLLTLMVVSPLRAGAASPDVDRPS